MMDEKVVNKIIQNFQQEVANWQLRALVAEASLQAKLEQEVQDSFNVAEEAPEPGEA